MKGIGFRVSVKNTNKKHGLNETFLKKVAGNTLKYLNRKICLEIIFLTDEAIVFFNKKYKKHDRPTDVLSFDLGGVGQILISSDAAFRNCRIYNTSPEEELVLYVIHGILHLFGYDDIDPAKRRRMENKQRELLEKLCRLNLSKVLTRR